MSCDGAITDSSHVPPRRSRNFGFLTESLSDEEELIRLLGFAPLKRIAEFACSKPKIDLHYPTQKLKTPLTAAIDRGDVSILKTLVDEYPSVSLDSTTTQPFGKTALMHASYVTRKSDVLGVLVERGADVHKVDMRGWNCLYYAIVGERKENIKFLLESGANLNCKDFHGRTPLMIAVILSTLEMAKYLLNHGADAGATDNLGFSALRLAILRKQQELAVLLVKSGSVLTYTPPISTHSDYELAKYLMPDLSPVIGVAQITCDQIVVEKL